MTGVELVEESRWLFRCKGLRWTWGGARLVFWVCRNLTRQGVECDRERLDFVIDVLWVMVLLGLSSESTEEQLEAAQDDLITWLEAMGWRRAWFMQSFSVPG